MIYARFARDEIINLAARRFARNYYYYYYYYYYCIFFVVQDCLWFKFYLFLLFWGMVLYNNEFERKEKKI